MYKKHIAEKGNTPKGERVETTAAVQEVMDETRMYDDEDDVSVIGNEVIADVQRLQKHRCTCGASRSASRFGYVLELTTRGAAPPVSSIAGSAIEQRGYRKVDWKERGLDAWVESSRLVLVKSV